jgi:uncharacterized membrane protein YciS (DUF1049 family)
MTIADWATTISGFLAVLLAVGGAFRWIIKNYLSEMKPNGGSSMKDQVNRLEKRVDEIYRILAERNG